MKNKLPEHPHTATPQIYKQANGQLFSMIEVKIAVPSRVAAMLAEHNGAHIIPSAQFWNAADVGKRAITWKNGCRIGKKKTLPHVNFLAQAAAEGCDTPIKIVISTEDWHLVGMLCGKLGITPGQWYLACAAYNAEVEEQHIEAQLAGIEEIEATDTAA